MKTMIFAAASFVFAATLAGAQSRPDFSGRWVLAPDSGATTSSQTTGGRRGGGPPPSIGSGWGSDITLAQSDSQLRLEYAFFTRSDMQPPHRFVFALDGSETVAKLMLGRGIEELRSRATWNASQLDIVTKQRIPDPSGKRTPLDVQVSRRLSLDTPTLLRVTTTRSALPGDPPSTIVTLYRKQ